MKNRWTNYIMLLLGFTLGVGAIAAAVINQPDLLRPLVRAGVPMTMMENLPLLGNAVLAAESDQISPIDLKQQLSQKSVLLIDVRTPAEFQRGHLPGALPVPIDQIQSGEGLAVIRSHLAQQPAAKLVTYCHSGVRSHRALSKLRRVGIQGTNLTGGIEAWHKQVDPAMPAPKS